MASSTVPPKPPKPAKRALAMAYCGGGLSMGLMDTLVFVVPLWALMLGASATEVGLLVGARSVLPFVFAIQSGVLMDRFGARRIMALVTVAMIVLAPLYPALPWIPAMMFIQMLTGLATTIAWIGAQTVIAQVCRGDTGYLGRFNFASRIGTFSAPILMGLLWDFTNPWLTFCFVSLWSAALLAVIRASADPQASSAGGAAEGMAKDEAAAGAKEAPRSPGARLADFIPRPADYTRTFALMAIPAIAITIGANFLRNTTSGVQGSIYVVYLDEIGLTGTAIGALFAAIEGASAIGSLLAGGAARRFSAYALMVVTTGLAIVLINITPLLGGIFALGAVRHPGSRRGPPPPGGDGGAPGHGQPLRLHHPAADPGHHRRYRGHRDELLPARRRAPGDDFGPRPGDAPCPRRRLLRRSVAGLLPCAGPRHAHRPGRRADFHVAASGGLT